MKNKRKHDNQQQAENLVRERLKALLDSGERFYSIPFHRVGIDGEDYMVDAGVILHQLGAISVGVNLYCGARPQQPAKVDDQDDGKITLGKLKELLDELIVTLGADYRVNVNVGVQLDQLQQHAAIASSLEGVGLEYEIIQESTDG